MKILLVHQNFPGQFGHLSRLLSSRGNDVVALTIGKPADACGARIVRTPVDRMPGAAHPWAQDFETKIVRGEASFRSALALRAGGFFPDLILAHPGWGDTLFLKDVWPDARLVIYCEYFYQAEGGDLDFDPEFSPVQSVEEARIRMRLRNLPQRLHMDVADAGLAPTAFQAGTYPLPFRDRIAVIHDGIDTAAVRPGPARSVRMRDGRTIAPGDEIVTFVSRTLEPYRGFHMLMRAWPAIQRARPAARLVVVGRDGTGYGTAPPGKSWRTLFTEELGDAIDPARIVFTGPVDYALHLNLLRLSTLHVYLTYPFVLSWSMLEAMATGCALLGSDTAPVREFVTHDDTGLLTPFFDPALLAAHAVALLEDSARRRRLGAAARTSVVGKVDLRSIIQPAQITWLDSIVARPARCGAPAA